MLQNVLAQIPNPCGNIKSYVPTVSNYNPCNQTTLYIYATGLPVNRWLYRDNNTGAWQVLSTSTSDNISTNVFASTPTIRTYRVVVSTSTCTDTTAGVDVTIQPRTYGVNNNVKISGSATTACVGSTLYLNVMQKGFSVDAWYYRDNGIGSWNNIGSGDQMTHTIANSTGNAVTREYRALLRTESSCNMDSTPAYTVIIPAPQNGNNNTIKPYIANNGSATICSGNFVSLQVNVNTNDVGGWVYKNTNASSWTSFYTGPYNYAYDYPSTSTTNITREYRVLVRKSNGCGYDTSDAVSVNIKPILFSNNSSILPKASQTAVCAGTSTSFNAPSNVSIYGWVYRDSATQAWRSGSSNISTSSAITKQLNREVRMIIYNITNNCSYDTSAAASTLINPNVRGNTTSHMPSTPSDEVCAGSEVRLYMPVNDASTWLYRTNDQGNWQNLGYNGQNGYDYSTNISTNTTRSYRVLINSTTNCRIDTTPEISVLIRVPQGGKTIAIQPIIDQPAYCAGAYVYGYISSLSSGLSNIAWVYRDNNSTTWNLLQSSGGLYDYNTNVTSTTIRTYRAIIRNSEQFTIDTSLEVSTTINPRVNGNINITHTMLTPSIVCNGATTQHQVNVPAGYTLAGWLYKDITNNQYSYTSSTSNPYTFYESTSQNKQRLYRALLFDQGQCKYDTTQPVTVNVNIPVAGNNASIVPTTSTEMPICSGSSLNMSIAIPSGTNINRWIYSDNNGAWTQTSNSSSNYSPSTNDLRVLAPTNRRYAIIHNNTTNCSVDTSAALLVTLSPWVTGGKTGITPIAGNSAICQGDYLSLNFSYNGSVQKWTYQDNNAGPWLDFGQGQSTSSSSTYQYTYTSVPLNRAYRAYVVRQGSCVIDTTNSVSVQINPSTYGNINATPTVSTQTICSGSTASISAPSVSGSNIYKWIYRDNSSPNWKDFINYTQSTSLQDDNTTTSNELTRYYRAIFLNSVSCRYDTTADASVIINPASQGYLSALNTTSSLSNICVSGASNTNATIGMSGTMPSGYATSKQFIYNDNNTGWQLITATTSSSYSHSISGIGEQTTRQYAVVGLSSTCSYDTTTAVSITLSPYTASYVTTVTPTTSSSSICAGSSNPTVSVNVPSGSNMRKWIYQDNGGDWMDFPYSATSTSLTDYITNISENTVRNYRALLNNSNACTIDSTNILSLALNTKGNGLVNQNLTTTNNRTTFCYGKPVTINVSLPSGYTTPITWIYSDNSGAWMTLTTSGSTSYTDYNTYVATTTSRVYRAVLTNNTNCTNDTTNALSVTINATGATLNGSTLKPNSITGTCSGTSVSLSVSPTTGNTVSRWIYSDDGNTWYDIYNSYNSTSITHYNTYVFASTPRQYKAVITDTTGCDFDTTQSTIVTINPLQNGYDTTYIMATTTGDSVCVGSPVSLNIPSGNYTIKKWQFKDNNNAWQDYTNTNRSITHTNTQVAVGTNRTYRVVLFNTNTCSNDTTSKNKTITFKSKTYGNGTAQTNVTVDTVCSGNSVSVSAGTSPVEAWLYKDGANGTWTLIPNQTSTSLTHTAVVTTPTWRYYRAVVTINNCQGDSTKADSVFVKFLTQGNVAITPTRGSTNPVCYGTSYNVSVSVNFPAQVYQWLYRTNGGIWQVYSTTTSTSVTDYNTYVTTPTTREFRAIIFRNCSYDTTNAISVPINPYGAGNSTTTPTISSANVCAGSPIQNVSVSGTVVQWLARTNSEPWSAFLNGNSSSITDYNTYVGAQTTRQYRAIIRNSTTCSNDTTQALSVTINPVVLGSSSRVPTASAGSSICVGTNFNTSMNVASDTTVKGWLTNTNGNTWSLTSTSSSLSINGNYYLSATTLGFRAVLYKASNCHIDTSAATFVTINPRTYGNDNTINAQVNSSSSASVCTGTSFNVSVNTGSGNSIQNWIYQNNGTGNWINYNTTSNNYSQTINTTTAYSRTYRALIIKGSACTIDTTEAATVTANPFTYGNDNAIVPNVNTQSICVGGTLSIGVTPGGSNTLINWMKRDNYSGNWSLMNLTTNNISEPNIYAANLTNRTYRALIRKGTACQIDTTAEDTALITPKTAGNDNSITPTTSNNSVCIGTPISVNVGSLGSGKSILKWIYNDNGGAWQNISGTSTSFTDYNVYPTATTNRTYRLIVANLNTCSNDTSATLNVTISPRTYGNDNSITPSANSTSICAGSYATISLSSLGSNTVEHWLVSNDGGASWNIFSSSTLTSITDYNSNVSVSTQRKYRAIIRKASGCSLDTSALVTVTFNPNGNGTQTSVIPQASKTSICVGSSVSLSVSGFTGSAVSQWLYRDDASSPWSVVNQPSTSFTDYNTNLGANATRTYRAIINNSTNCSYDTTSSASVIINTITNGTAAVAPTTTTSTFCSGNSVRVSISASGYTVQGWLIRTDGGTWAVLSNTTATSVYDYSTTVTSQTTKSYRAMLKSNSACSLDSSAVVNVTINPIGAGNSTLTPTTSTPSVCSGTTMQANISASQVISWLYRDTVVNDWAIYSSSSSSIYLTAPTVTYPRTRAFRAIIYNTVNCSYDTTNEVTVQINPSVNGNAPSIAPASANTVYCSGNPVSATLTGLVGTVEYWIFRDNNGAWNILSGTTSITHNATTVTTFTTRQYRALVVAGCNTDTTATLTVTIDAMPAQPSISNPTGTDSLICSDDAASYIWYKGGVVINGATEKVYRPTESGNYQVEVANASNCKTLSDVFTYNHTGLTSTELNTALKLYPNPTTNGNVVIELSNTNIKNVKVVVMDMIGKIVAENNELSNGIINIQLGEQAKSGVYFVTIEAGGATITKRVVYSKQ